MLQYKAPQYILHWLILYKEIREHSKWDVEAWMSWILYDIIWMGYHSYLVLRKYKLWTEWSSICFLFWILTEILEQQSSIFGLYEHLFYHNKIDITKGILTILFTALLKYSNTDKSNAGSFESEWKLRWILITKGSFVYLFILMEVFHENF